MEGRSLSEHWANNEENTWLDEQTLDSLSNDSCGLPEHDLSFEEFEADVSLAPLPTTIDRIVTEFQKKVKTNGKSPEEYVREYQLTTDPQKKKRLKELITAHYIRMLAKLAIKIAKQYQIPDDLYPDLLNESIIILHKCLNNYDSTRGVKFSSYLYRAAFSGIKRAILSKFHLVRDKSYLHKYNQKQEDEKFSYIRLEEAALTRISYELSPDEIHKEVDAQSFLQKFLKEIPHPTRQLLIKIMNDEKLTKTEKETFRRLRPHLLKYLKEKYGVNSLDDIL